MKIIRRMMRNHRIWGRRIFRYGYESESMAIDRDLPILIQESNTISSPMNKGIWICLNIVYVYIYIYTYVYTHVHTYKLDIEFLMNTRQTEYKSWTWWSRCHPLSWLSCGWLLDSAFRTWLCQWDVDSVPVPIIVRPTYVSNYFTNTYQPSTGSIYPPYIQSSIEEIK